MPILLVLASLSSVIVLPVSAVVWPFRIGLRITEPRWRALRILEMLELYLLGECLCILARLGLWAVTGFGWRLAVH